MEATLEEFQKDAGKLIASAAAHKQPVLIKKGGNLLATVEPALPVNRKAALEALRKIGPVDLLPRK